MTEGEREGERHSLLCCGGREPGLKLEKKKIIIIMLLIRVLLFTLIAV